MVQRQFAAFDNEAFVVDASSPNLTAGSSIINNSSTPVGTIFNLRGGFEFQTIIVDDTSDDPNTFEDDEPDQHVIVEGRGLVENGTEVESESFHFLRALDENGNPTGPTITVTVFSQMGQFSNIWGMATDTELQEGIRYVKTGGSNNGDSEYSTFVPCFTPGTVLSTARGSVHIENLSVGDRVMTRDNGLQDIHWIGRKDLDAASLVANPGFVPVVIKQGALGNGLPQHEITVSPNHRMLVSGAHLAIHFGETEVLIAAKHLVGLPGIISGQAQDVSYMHLLCGRHEVIFANGVWTESFQPGDYSMRGLGTDQAAEVFALFPELRDPTLKLQFRDARTALRGFEAQIVKNALAA